MQRLDGSTIRLAMAKKNERDAHREQAAEPANEQPIVALRFIEINKQGQLVSKTEHLHQNAERARKRVRQLGKRRKRWRRPRRLCL